MELTAETIANHLNGEVIGDKDLALTGFAPATTAKPGELTFAENASFFAKAESSDASAILVEQEFESSGKTLIKVDSSRIAFAQVLPLFFPEPTVEPGVDPLARVAASANVHSSVHVGPYCFVGENASIGANTVLHSGTSIGPDVTIGENCLFYSNVSVYHRCEVGDRVSIHSGTVVGSDGFGYVMDEGSHRKIPQVGNVILGNDVEIGANVTIDRGTLGPTVIGAGTKIDNLVQVAHNVQIGERCIIIAQVGIAGSTKIGSDTQIGGQVGIAGHLKIGDHVQIAAQAGVMHDIPDGEKWFGSPAGPDRKTKRILLAIQQLPRLIKRVSELEQWAGRKKPRGNERAARD